MTRKIGLTLPQRGTFFDVLSLSELVETGHWADETGLFDSLWIGDSLLAKPRPEAVALFGSLAAATRNVTLAVGCMASFPVRDPILFADQWATLDQLSGGRMLLAVCTGIVKPKDASAREGAPYGVTDGSRAARMEENTEIVRRLWTEDDVTYEGRYTSFENVTVLPKPVQSPPPIYIASNPAPQPLATRALHRVARIADGWMTTRKSPEHLTVNLPAIKQYLGEEGRDPESFAVSAYHNLNLSPDREAAYEESYRFLGEYYGPVFSREATRHWTATGTPEQAAADIEQLYADGATEVTLRITSWDWRRQLDLLVKEVVPRLTDAA
ncbi:alkanesulfonate monooxygenase SsuD/methylene tetrahydromethanopterin reductase-like flavin-dependent oxidoreductase (luciferase family) [Pseudonocardia hierapolitana]|uniref:Alkanesulfonate monooxygenase SsuD/methylene tetrahydromethanopterin reductase-like flavin-dependent oxidoreductase (Luciferase family) n=1 Tax=Pseudonocardia hierapolitana TaxID=1128676 RepID=A0A561SY79_9PSEU|nr:LLM class flavin-dependent oxidoreductase [Pseudonocardia hierapolitana]TWF79817.1 alkanesulfonate monooxygenase SsuD/methylene tetrahydromethanopterin reductase-like flavin-dependent oxidoreductase (luciferase family) [Pseudonocardia hierapolitana]